MGDSLRENLWSGAQQSSPTGPPGSMASKQPSDRGYSRGQRVKGHRLVVVDDRVLFLSSSVSAWVENPVRHAVGAGVPAGKSAGAQKPQHVPRVCLITPSGPTSNVTTGLHTEDGEAAAAPGIVIPSGFRRRR